MSVHPYAAGWGYWRWGLSDETEKTQTYALYGFRGGHTLSSLQRRAVGGTHLDIEQGTISWWAGDRADPIAQGTLHPEMTPQGVEHASTEAALLVRRALGLVPHEEPQTTDNTERTP